MLTKALLGKLYLFIIKFLFKFKGISFYIPLNIENEPCGSYSIELTKNEKITFYFYKYQSKDYYFKRGKLIDKIITLFKIQAEIPETITGDIAQFKNVGIHVPAIRFISDEEMIKILFNIYLDFMISKLKK